MEPEELRQLLNQPYTSENWKRVVEYVFPNVSLLSKPQDIPFDNAKVESFKQTGNVRMHDGKNLAMFEVHVAENVNIARNRVELRNLVAPMIDQERNHGVLVIYEQGKADYRFTFTAKASEINMETGEFTSKETDAKRYTYVLGENESCKTAAQRFFSLAEKRESATIKDVQDAFSVEKVSKQFFKEYKDHYQKMVDYLLSVEGYHRTIFKGDDKKVRDFVKLLLGRLVFIQFVQKKRWMGVPATDSGWTNGDARFLYNSFQNFEHKNLFYSQFLEPLFYEAMNNGGRKDYLFKPTGTKVPYLNGGLFENGNTDTSLINFPAANFESLFEFFDQYNFTIDENDPEEHEVGIDPEMLGHVFENLLEDNKDKGAFYTPKEIVHYMCQESLKEYLKTSLEDKKLWPADEAQAKELEEYLQNFIQKKEASNIIDYDEVLAIALRDVKICDPAIGSGAFPMGLLNEIYQCVNVLYEARPQRVGNVWGMDSWQPNVVKANIIQNSIYGVDIENGAVDIARLRFWLSLIVDEPEPTALPNLDYKIVVGNSLVSKLDDDIIDIDWTLNDTSHGLFGQDLAEEKARLLQQISKEQKDFFRPESDKHTLAVDIRNLKIDLLINQLELMVKTKGLEVPPIGNHKNIQKQTDLYIQTQGWKNQISKLQKLKTEIEKPLHFFDWKLDFPEIMNEQVADKVGFDIVIGNPPYRQIKWISEDYSHSSYNSYSKSTDIYCLFFEKAISLMRSNSIMIFITSNKWLRAEYGKKLKEYLLSNTKSIKLIDFGGYQVFENATVDTNISILKKSAYGTSKISYSKCDNLTKLKSEINGIVEKINYLDIWVLESERVSKLKSKIERNNDKLEQFPILFYYGILTGANSTFILNESQRKVLLENCSISSKYLVPILRGKDLEKYWFKYAKYYLLNIHNGISKKNIPPVELDISEETCLFEYLETFGESFKSRGEKGTNWYNLRSCNYIDLYLKPKILYSDIVQEDGKFYYDAKGFFSNDTAFMIYSEDQNILKFLTGILNSKVASFLYRKFYCGGSLGNKGFRYKKEFLRNLPVPGLKESVVRAVEKIISYKADGINTSGIEKEVDNLAYKLYKLSYDEVLVIEPEFGERMSREEYGAIELEA